MFVDVSHGHVELLNNGELDAFPRFTFEFPFGAC
jgi:hypothetical protein